MLTGASSGIGAAMAERLAARGYRLLIVGRRRGALAEVIERIASRETARSAVPGGHLIAELDLERLDQIKPVVEAAIPASADVALLVNCAGVGIYRPFLDCSSDDAVRLMRVNYFAAAELIRVLLPHLLTRGSGHIINVASISAKIGPWGHSAYAPAKAALVSLTETLAAEHAGSGVHFSYVNPGIVETPYFESPDLARLWRRVRRHAISADAVARRIVGLLDRPRLQLCVPRHYRALDFLAAISPSLAHRMVARQSRPRESAAQEPPVDSADLDVATSTAPRI